MKTKRKKRRTEALLQDIVRMETHSPHRILLIMWNSMTPKPIATWTHLQISFSSLQNRNLWIPFLLLPIRKVSTKKKSLSPPHSSSLIEQVAWHPCTS
jgi:hypothetical protein